LPLWAIRVSISGDRRPYGRKTQELYQVRSTISAQILPLY
jgi:hypothetical protein